MNALIMARVLHLLGVVLWIGGVATVTLVILPAVRRFKDPAEGTALFERIEGRFAWQARAWILLVGATGFYLSWMLDLWDRFRSPHYWWMHAMVVIWAIFVLMLFVLEPLFLDRWFAKRAAVAPADTFRLIQSLHGFLLIVSLLTAAGAAAGSHGWTF